MVKQYANEGKVRFVPRHLAFQGGENGSSIKAAAASECAGEQGKFWDYQDLIYRNQSLLRAAPQGNTDLLKTWAGQAGVDQASFNACLDSGKYAEVVRQETSEGRRLGISSTPSLVIDGQVLKGAGGGVPNADEVKAALDQALAKKGK